MTSRRAFTILELLVVIAIIATLLTMLAPEAAKFLDRARSASCMGNLRQLGTAVGLYLNDNDNTFPFINNPANPVYTDPSEIPDGVTPKTMLEAFGPYGITANVLRCPADALLNNRFASEGTSYEWRPMLDGEPRSNPEIYTRRGGVRVARLSRFRLVFDTDNVHSGRQNLLYADGSVRMTP